MAALPRTSSRGGSHKILWVLLALVAMMLLGRLFPEESSSNSASKSGRSGGTATTVPSTREDTKGDFPSTTLSEDTTTTAPPATEAPPIPSPPAPAPPPAPGAVAVVQIIDGDTIEVAGGQRVRLIGIDTPERGQCGYTEAALTLAAIIQNRPVVLVPGARTDKDRYGRLLRYVEVDGVDVNLEMIRSGRAIARYDSRDGYGRHPREDIYIAADEASPSTNYCAPAPSATQAPARLADPVAPAAPTGALDPRFGTCKEAKAHGYGPYVRGVDAEYDWYTDRDRDGVVCE